MLQVTPTGATWNSSNNSIDLAVTVPTAYSNGDTASKDHLAQIMFQTLYSGKRLS